MAATGAKPVPDIKLSAEDLVKRLSHRKWPDIAGLLIGPLSSLQFEPGARPDYSFGEFVGLAPLVELAGKTGEYRAELALTGLHSAILHEAIFLLHKSSNILVACHDQVVSGLPTWSLATGYQAAYFASEAILRMLGVFESDLANSKSFVVDVWPESPSGTSKAAQKEYIRGSELQLYRCKQFSHVDHWALFLRVLRTTKNICFEPKLVAALVSIKDREFAQQRNRLHYQNNWPLSDLHGYLSQLNFFSSKDVDELVISLSPGSQDFSVALGSTLWAFAATMLQDLAQLSSIARQELDVLLDACQMPRLKLSDTVRRCVPSLALV